MNLLVTCARHLETETKDELNNLLTRFGDKNPIVTISKMSGILTAETQIDPFQVIENARKLIMEEPWEIRYCFRIIPIQKTVKTNLQEIKIHALELIKTINKNDTYRITVEKRHSELSTNEIISEVAPYIPNKVSLENPDWNLLIEVIGSLTGISLLKQNGILSVKREKRIV